MTRSVYIKNIIAAIFLSGIMQACNNQDLFSEKSSNGVLSGQLMESRGAEGDGEVSYYSGYFTAVAFDAEGALVMVRENIKVDQNGQFSLTIGSSAKKMLLHSQCSQGGDSDLWSNRDRFQGDGDDRSVGQYTGSGHAGCD